MTRQEAIAAKELHYQGKVCVSHPEAGGLRMTSNGGCLRCLREYGNQHYKDYYIKAVLGKGENHV